MTLLLSTTASAQGISAGSVISTPPLEISIAPETVTEVSKIHMSSTMTAHTYKLNATSATSDQDINPTPVPSSEITAMINSFSAVSGVTECTFDNATQTFTIYSSPTTNLEAAVDVINNN